MTDSGALRVKRWRLHHYKDDHSECLIEHCPFGIARHIVLDKETLSAIQHEIAGAPTNPVAWVQALIDERLGSYASRSAGTASNHQSDYSDAVD